MGKLHELLAIEGDLKSAAQQAKGKIVGLFTDGLSRFGGKVITYRVDEGEVERPSEVMRLSTTVTAELEEFYQSFGRWVDAAFQKEITNATTSAEVEIDGVPIFADLPATALLNLESKLAELKTVLNAIPVNDNATTWTWDEGAGRYTSDEQITAITKKVPTVLTLAEATAEHPAQAEVYHKDLRVGTRHTVFHSGGLSPKDKRDMIRRLDNLCRAVKQARQRANTADAVSVKVADTIFSYISGVDL